jgi:hypothetical protein
VRKRPPQDFPPDRAIAANAPPVRRAIDAELIIVAVTPAVERLARAARAIREECKTAKTQVPGFGRRR